MATPLYIKAISSKSQVVLPRRVRAALGVIPGDRLVLTVEGATLVVAPLRRSVVDETAGSLRRFIATALRGRPREDVRAMAATRAAESSEGGDGPMSAQPVE